eukprot:7171374-Pyramimonas_sp.AAC.1
MDDGTASSKEIPYNTQLTTQTRALTKLEPLVQLLKASGCTIELDTDTVALTSKTLLKYLITREFNSPINSLQAPYIRVELYLQNPRVGRSRGRWLSGRHLIGAGGVAWLSGRYPIRAGGVICGAGEGVPYCLRGDLAGTGVLCVLRGQLRAGQLLPSPPSEPPPLICLPRPWLTMPPCVTPAACLTLFCIPFGMNAKRQTLYAVRACAARR